MIKLAGHEGVLCVCKVEKAGVVVTVPGENDYYTTRDGIGGGQCYWPPPRK